MKIVVFGRNGQIASALQKTQSSHLQIRYFGHEEAPFEKKESVLGILQKEQPEVVINASAYTAVDLAETEKLECYRINCETPAFLAKWCATHQVVFIQYSTDYVFDGKKSEPYVESDVTDPLNVYGKSKRDAEVVILKENPASYIFRTSWVYNENGKNFLNTMLRLRDKDTLKIVSDQVGSPTYATDIALATWDVVMHPDFKKYFGIYHMVSQGFVSWFEFARAIFQPVSPRPQLEAILTRDYKTDAARPLSSRLNTDKLYKDFGVRLPFWEDSLKVCMKNKL